MFSSTKPVFLSILFALAIAGAGVAADSATEASRASQGIESALDQDATDLTTQLDEVNQEMWMTRMDGTAGNASDSQIASQLDKSIDKANADLARAAKRDEYTYQRRNLENTRSLYYPGTPEYNRFTQEMEKLDQEFAASESNRAK